MLFRSLQRRYEAADAKTRGRNLQHAAEIVAEIARQTDVVITHGNGPQVGYLALAAANSAGSAEALDVLVAQSEGMIGYILERDLAEQLPRRTIATLLTQVEVDPNDPAFRTPTKPIGPVYSDIEAWRLVADRGWRIVRDGNGYRRAVASPEPRRLRELVAIKILVDAGSLVICSGGGGIPVVVGADGSLRGVEAVIDKDLSAAILAEGIGADALLLLTDVQAVLTERGDRGRAIAQATPAQLREFRFAPGSMGPKVEGACRFVERTGGIAVIGALTDARALLAGCGGTLVKQSNDPIRYFEGAAGD